ncbi:MAG: hypothetical protein E7231_15015 [Cellulosilyticum sp.]|nr:hypothetical protein [Cellulosilyticum sp.]
MIREWFKLTALSSGSLLGVYVIFGIILDQIEQLNIRYIASTFGRLGIITTGWIGTVIHEASHALMCLLFGHQIVEVAWFRPIQGMKDGVLGYVQHSYNPSNLYQQVGNFFIGIAPLLLGGIIILILFKICLPQSSRQFTEKMRYNIQSLSGSFTLIHIIQIMGLQIMNLFESLWNKQNIKKPSFWIFLFIAYSISTHMSLSFADLQGAAIGLGVILIGLVILSFILALFHLPVKKCATLLIKYNAVMVSIFSIALGFSFMTLVISALLYYFLR